MIAAKETLSSLGWVFLTVKWVLRFKVSNNPTSGCWLNVSHLSDHCLFFSFAILSFYIPKSSSCAPSWVTAWTHVHVPSVSEYTNRMCNLRDANVVASVQQHCTLFPCKVLSVLVYVYFIVINRLWISRFGEFHSTMRDYLKKKKTWTKAAWVIVVSWLLFTLQW